MLSSMRRLSLSLLLACACNDPSPGSVQIAGTGAPLTLSPAALTELPATEILYKDHTYTGVRLRDVLAHANLGAHQPLTATGADGHAKDLDPATLQRDDAIVAYAVDDMLLRADEGPLHLVVAGSPDLSIKRLARLDVGGAPAAAGTAAR